MRAERTALLSLVLFAARASAADSPAVPADPYEEAQTTASRQPSPVRLAPATVYVMTSQDIRESGVRTLYDALRSVPGVEVLATRASHAEVSIRGFDQPLANRTLVLLDGRTVLNGYFDNVIWEEIPVTLEEVDRIEVVEGPAS
ncbi:MAG: TonB-dependent receptor plug domain-containing protein, partial [bacterium]